MNSRHDAISNIAQQLDRTSHGLATEEELLFKTTLLEAQLETTIDGILVVSSEGRSILFNRRFGQMWNLPPELLNRKDDESMLDHALTQLKEPEAFLKKVRYLYDHREEESRDEIHLKDGRVFDRYSAPLFDKVGKYHGRIWFFRDMTEHKRREQQLQESHARYHAVFTSSGEGILVADLETKLFKYANPTICAMLGYAEEELIGMGVADIHPKDVLKHVISEFISQARGEKILSTDVPCQRKDGTVIYADITATKVVIDGRECNVGFFTDITERKKAQAEKEKLISELQNALNNIRTLKGLLPICASCKKIRDDEGYWNQIESYIRDHSEAEFSHGICPECAKKFYPDYIDDDK